MKFKVDEITSIIRTEIAQYDAQLELADVGQVMTVGDGIARIYGLGNAQAGEMLQFENGAFGQVMNLEDNSIGAVIFGDDATINEGMTVKGTGRLLSVPVGRALVGRVVNPLGQPLDGKGEIITDLSRPVEVKAPGIAARQPVNEPLQTGIKAIDSMIPIGRGQRELIIGDRKTGKTSVATETILNQKKFFGTDREVICVYVAIGQKESTIAATVEALRQNGAMDYTIVVAAGASDPAPLQYIAPYAGCTMAEHFMLEGKHTLCIYDDLTKQAQAYRQLSLLLRRPPGREAYPGDVFYLHSRLLERAAKLKDEYAIVLKSTPETSTSRSAAVNGRVYERGEGPNSLHDAKKDLEALPNKDDCRIHRFPDSGGSLTALPIIETQEGEVSAYIPTNVISITDGQIYLEPDLFNAGTRPAINVGISVSRVGGNAQTPGMKSVAGSLRLALAAYRELEAFAQLGTELDPATQKQLDRGARMVEVLKQGLFTPYAVADQVAMIFAGNEGLLDELKVNQVKAFELDFLKHFKTSHRAFYDEFEAKLLTGKVAGEIAAKLTDIFKTYVKDWLREQNEPTR